MVLGFGALGCQVEGLGLRVIDGVESFGVQGLGFKV